MTAQIFVPNAKKVRFVQNWFIFSNFFSFWYLGVGIVFTHCNNDKLVKGMNLRFQMYRCQSKFNVKDFRDCYSFKSPIFYFYNYNSKDANDYFSSMPHHIFFLFENITRICMPFDASKAWSRALCYKSISNATWILIFLLFHSVLSAYLFSIKCNTFVINVHLFSCCCIKLTRV